MSSRARASKGWLAALAVMAGLAAGCTGAPPASELLPSRVRTVFANYPSLTLIGNTDRNGEILGYLVSEGLVRYDVSLRLQPRVATSWEVSPDGLVWTFHLREGVRWHDGAPVTADDVVFTVGKVRDPATLSPGYISLFDDLVSIEAIDASTVRATYRTPYADALESWTLPLIPRHLAGKDADFLGGEFSRHPVGCGPYKFVRAEPDRQIVLAANEDYWEGRPKVSEIDFRVIRDERTSFQALLRGELDLLSVTPEYWRAAREQNDKQRITGSVAYRLDAWYIGWNGDKSNPFFDDPRVRRAMVLALDRQRFVDHALDGLGRVAVGTYHPDSVWFDPATSPWPYDPVAAGELLDEAGWRDSDRDGIRDRAGVPFSFTLLTAVSSQDLADRTSAWVQDSLAKLGVRVSIERIPWENYRERRREHRFEAAVASLSFTPIPDRYELYHSSSRDRGMNFWGFADTEVDRLLEEGRRTFDSSLRGAVYGRLQERLHELEPISCLFHFAAPVLHDARLTDIGRSPIGLWLTTPGPRVWRWTPDARGS